MITQQKTNWKFQKQTTKPLSKKIGDNKDQALDTSDATSSSPRVYRVPEDIRPKMATYRLEVIFWGVRDMRRLNLVPVHRPKIVVECASVHVESEVMENVKRFANFQETRVTVDLVITYLIYYCSFLYIENWMKFFLQNWFSLCSKF